MGTTVRDNAKRVNRVVNMSLKDDLQEIEGVGEATAEKILDIINNHETDGVSRDELERIHALLERGSDEVAQSRLEDLL